MPVMPAPSRWSFGRVPDEADDLVSIGGDLEPGTLLAAYAGGLFPMPVPELGIPDGIGWFCPRNRGVLPLDGMKVSRSLRQSARHFEIRVDTAFDEVVTGCADPARTGGWIDDRMASAYARLHELGWAHSVETWADGELAGGLYGVAIGGLFAGESMFSRRRDASKVALLALVEMLSDEHVERRVLDTQWRTDHLATLGVLEIPRTEYLTHVVEALQVPLPPAFAGT